MNTKQEEFDAVVKHLYAQGRPAKDNKGNCCYRAGQVDELSCAVGCRIPDAAYDPQMDSDDGTGTGISSLIENFFSVIPLEINEYRDMFRELQAIHDTAELNDDGTFDLDQLNMHLALVASANGLNFTSPNVTVTF